MRASCLFKLSLVVSISGDVGTVLAAVVLDYVSWCLRTGQIIIIFISIYSLLNTQHDFTVVIAAFCQLGHCATNMFFCQHISVASYGALAPPPFNFHNLFSSVHFESAHSLTATLYSYLFKHFTVCDSSLYSLLVAIHEDISWNFSATNYFYLGRVLCPPPRVEPNPGVTTVSASVCLWRVQRWWVVVRQRAGR